MMDSMMGEIEKHYQVLDFINIMAGKEGFEPSVLEYQYAGFRIRCIRPLCHLPGDLPLEAARVAIEGRILDDQAFSTSAPPR